MILFYKKKLEEVGLEKGDRICAILPNGLEFVLLFFSSLFSEIQFIPIDPSRGKLEMNEIIADSLPKYIINNSQYTIDYELISLNHFEGFKSLESNDEVNLIDKINFNLPFLITFTSGSTGIPKGIIHSFNNLVKSSISFNSRFQFNENNIFYHNFPMSYMAGILNLLILPLFSKSKLIIGNRFDFSEAIHFWKIPIKYSANTFWFNPTMLELLIKLDRGNEGINYCKNSNIIGCVGTAPLTLKTKESFESKYNLELFESYGLSETLFISTNYPQHNKSNTVGKTIDGVSLSFNDDGEILVASPWNFIEYLKVYNSQKDGSFFHTGDLGEFNKDGFLKITGRKKDLIIKGGVNISPKRIEDFISKFEIFDEFKILGIEDKYMTEKIGCFFISNKKVFTQDLKKKINNEIIKDLGRDFHIDEFIELNDIPKTTNGKIDKLKILENYKKNIYVSRN